MEGLGWMKNVDPKKTKLIHISCLYHIRCGEKKQTLQIHSRIGIKTYIHTFDRLKGLMGVNVAVDVSHLVIWNFL